VSRIKAFVRFNCHHCESLGMHLDQYFPFKNTQALETGTERAELTFPLNDADFLPAE
jgi:hypothetical protein